ncbi:hypothetical protein GCM10027442_25850 [Emticicia fontis]
MLLFQGKPSYVDILAGLSAMLYFGFFILSYQFLRQFEKEPKNIQRFFFFLLNLIFAWVFIAIALNGYTLNFLETVLVLPFIMLFMGYILYVLASKLNTIEKTLDVTTQSTFLYMLLFLLLPIGIWLIARQFKQLKEIP